MELRDVKLRRYQREGSPGLVLCADIRGGERIAVVGMSGEERCSFVDALLRFYELDTGHILIDGVDLSTLPLHTLRSIICVIPSELVLFEGTLRYNLDPYNEYSDTAVWEALTHCPSTQLLRCLDKEGLEARVESRGGNFTTWERQIICWGRAILRQSKIVVVDMTSQTFHQQRTNPPLPSSNHFTVLQEALPSSTIITLINNNNNNNNINNINLESFNRVMVVQEGKVVEFDTSANLTKDPSSVLWSLLFAARTKPTMAPV
ncbi:hypothetical protein Pmani_035383 [Petrolisthes manimaculis]|uniref:ABC transporter domain-containing protein n=1 Tax=Petrolisthes manimaculis TaxID=1843537 RepID=A0AAE1NKL7_9EUCA|nr:hypothetical protein Pmani_035383 [Petrolisthes manimaculis]